MNIDKAYNKLITLIDEGVEFSEAEYQVREAYNLSEEDWKEILEMYDNDYRY